MTRSRTPKFNRETAPAYTAVGSRSTPDHVLELMEKIARDLYDIGYTLRSGGADGADQAFGRGARERAHIYLPWTDFGHVEPGALSVALGSQIEPELSRIAATIHPNWANLTVGPRKLHARNVRQLLGTTLRRPSQFLICWTPDARPVGGTATALKLADQLRVPVYNLAWRDLYEAFRDQHIGDVISFPDDHVMPATLTSELPF